MRNLPNGQDAPTVGWIFYEECKETEQGGTTIRMHSKHTYDPEPVKHALYILGKGFERGLVRLVTQEARERLG